MTNYLIFGAGLFVGVCAGLMIAGLIGLAGHERLQEEIAFLRARLASKQELVESYRARLTRSKAR